MTPGLDCVIEGGSLITGDGSTCLEIASVGLFHGFVEVVLLGKPEPAVSARQTIDATGVWCFRVSSTLMGITALSGHRCPAGLRRPRKRLSPGKGTAICFLAPRRSSTSVALPCRKSLRAATPILLVSSVANDLAVRVWL